LPSPYLQSATGTLRPAARSSKTIDATPDMCVAFFFWDCLDDLLLLLAFNRDEILDR
jgi:hypothetical protein